MNSRYGLEIRAATAADAPGIASLLSADGPAAPPHLVLARLEALRQEPGAVLIAVEWGPPSGLIAIHWRHSLTADLPTAQVSLLVVDVESRRRGIGRLLLKAASQAARLAGCDALEIIPTPAPSPLWAFCRATGFVDNGISLTRPLRKRG